MKYTAYNALTYNVCCCLQMNVRQLKAGLRLVGSLSQLGRSVTKALVVSTQLVSVLVILCVLCTMHCKVSVLVALRMLCTLCVVRNEIRNSVHIRIVLASLVGLH